MLKAILFLLLYSQAVLDKERKGDYLGKTVQVRLLLGVEVWKTLLIFIMLFCNGFFLVKTGYDFIIDGASYN